MPINSNSIYVGKGVLGSTAGAPLSADSNGLLASGISNSEASATSDTTTTSGTDVLINSMTLTPVAGTYLVMFSTSVECSSAGASIFTSIYSGGSQVAHTERQAIPFATGITLGGSSQSIGLAQQCIATVNGSQAIEARWRRSAGTATAHERTLTIVRIS